MKFLYCVWAFNKNFEYVGSKQEDEVDSDESKDN